jgi:hypothetical protein
MSTYISKPIHLSKSKSKQYIKLNNDESKKYIKYSKFRNEINKYIQSPKDQLHLDLSYSMHLSQDELAIIGTVHSVDLSFTTIGDGNMHYLNSLSQLIITSSYTVYENLLRCENSSIAGLNQLYNIDTLVILYKFNDYNDKDIYQKQKNMMPTIPLNCNRVMGINGYPIADVRGNSETLLINALSTKILNENQIRQKNKFI